MLVNIKIQKDNNIGKFDEEGYILDFKNNETKFNKLKIVENDGYNIIFKKNDNTIFKIKFVCLKIDGFNKGDLELLHSVESYKDKDYCFVKNKDNIKINLDFDYDNVKFVRLYYPNDV